MEVETVFLFKLRVDFLFPNWQSHCEGGCGLSPHQLHHPRGDSISVSRDSGAHRLHIRGLIKREIKYYFDKIRQVEQARSRTVSDLWNITNTYNTLNKRSQLTLRSINGNIYRLWRQTTQHIIRSYQEDIITNIKAGYDSRTVEERWTFPSALMFTLSVITAIG